jgi:hypothetical protein
MWCCGIAGPLVMQPARDGTAKPYQLRQLRDAIEAHGLSLE